MHIILDISNPTAIHGLYEALKLCEELIIQGTNAAPITLKNSPDQPE